MNLHQLHTFGLLTLLRYLLLKADKKTVKALERNLKEEESFGNWLEKNNPRIAKRLMNMQIEEKKKYGMKKKVIKDEKEAVSATVTAST